MLKSIVDKYGKIFSILEMKETADKAKKTKVLDKILCLPRDRMESIVEFLEFFKKATKEVEFENKPVLYRVWLLFKRIDSYLEFRTTDSIIVSKMKEIGRNYVSSIDNVNDMRLTSEHKLAVFLHPLMKGMRFVLEEERNEIHADALKRLGELNLNSHDVSNESTIEEQRENSDNIRKNHEQSILDEFCDEMQPSIQIDANLIDAKTEMANYLNLIISSPAIENKDSFDLIDWWKTNRTSLPRLFRLFFRISSIQATSASSERCFSNTGFIKSAKRSSLNGSTINNLMLARAEFNKKNLIFKNGIVING